MIKKSKYNTKVFFYRAFTCNVGFLWHEELIEGGLRQAFDVARCDFHFVSRVPLQRLQHRKIICPWNELGHPLLLFILRRERRVEGRGEMYKKSPFALEWIKILINALHFLSLCELQRERPGRVVLCDKQQLTLCVFNLGIGRVTAIRKTALQLRNAHADSLARVKTKGNPLVFCFFSMRFSQVLGYLSVPLWLQLFLFLTSLFLSFFFVLRPISNKGLKSVEFGCVDGWCAYHSRTFPSLC